MPSPRAADDARRSVRRALAGVCGGVLALTFAGCSGTPDVEPTAAPTETVAATAAPTPTPTAPVRPEAMDDPGTKGAVAAATYFMELYAYVGGGDLAEWRALSHPECIFCTAVIDEVERMASLGHRQEGPEITINATQPTEVTPGEFYGVDFDVIQGAHRELDGQGNVVTENSTPTAYTVHIIVVRQDGQWLVRAGEPVET
jgi:hypothetical protein